MLRDRQWTYTYGEIFVKLDFQIYRWINRSSCAVVRFATL